jgi:hypothetical protein
MNNKNNQLIDIEKKLIHLKSDMNHAWIESRHKDPNNETTITISS